MKTLILITLLVTLVGCASQERTSADTPSGVIHVSDKGDIDKQRESLYLEIQSR
ncbi:hypothetical protein [Rubellicoccus peritrichatus]|uniref:Uncharacterized protein n=1 Tax=Rubellicoccus peritrichatus TaxID=3080537 RepID=A0AAQ3QSP1_9BACT|nr:hypothetical protein [Puniceicoccus sp. CR14]WOO40369.1 hypothetical protein RZN69_17255 [Puniceicoccus sp. CR14]WOO40418.1 hypothetical protein RZN69_17500 [Puniceicoccus sp. CR14]WOO40467.1 hypothetical protein RZN69_17745 [Puniceicoccus sp. CR14]WOO40516.1 hypothetical protein RZN69_17990 [Puniceicoccus sp. CR14]